MRISIFPQVKPLPSKEEKPKEAKKTGIIKDKKTGEIIKEYLPEIVEIETEEDLLRVLSSYAWSPNVFKGARSQDNFKSTDFVVLDIDDGMTIEQAESIIETSGFTCLCMPSTSHTKEHHKFRLVFPLSRTINDKDTYSATMSDLVEVFTCADPKCVHDYARFYFSHRTDDGFWIEGDLLEPVEPPRTNVNSSTRRFDVSTKVRTSEDIKELIKDLYGEERDQISESVAYFIENAKNGLPGEWVISLNNCVLVLAYQGIDYDTIYDLIEYLAPNPLDKRDIATIKKAFEDGVRDSKNNKE
jgi:hypothetical protein